jgi:hypothetical protein
MACSVSLQEGLSIWAMVSIGVVEDGPLEPLVAQPLMGMAWLASFLILLGACVFTISLGSQLCPAVASSTIFTSVSMSLGYVAQSVIHRQRPAALTAVGASLMLLAVALIAAARWWQSRAASARGLEVGLLSDEENEVVKDVDNQAESLASFIAAEFSGFGYTSKSVRQRRIFNASAESLRMTLA